MNTELKLLIIENAIPEIEIEANKILSKRLGKSRLKAYQASSRGGVVHVSVNGDRVMLGGNAVGVRWMIRMKYLGQSREMGLYV